MSSDKKGEWTFKQGNNASATILRGYLISTDAMYDTGPDRAMSPPVLCTGETIAYTGIMHLYDKSLVELS